MFDEPVNVVMRQEISLTVSPQTLVSDAAKLMADRNVGAVMILESGLLVGIVTERDIVFRVVAAGLIGHLTRVGDVMTAAPVTVDAGRSYGSALLIMQEGGFRQLPVVEDGKLVGIVSSRNAMDPALEEFASEVRRRKHFEDQRLKPL